MHVVPATKKVNVGGSYERVYFFSVYRNVRDEGISNLFFTMRFRKAQSRDREKREHLDYRIQHVSVNSAAINQTVEITLTHG